MIKQACGGGGGRGTLLRNTVQFSLDIFDLNIYSREIAAMQGIAGGKQAKGPPTKQPLKLLTTC